MLYLADLSVKPPLVRACVSVPVLCRMRAGRTTCARLLQQEELGLDRCGGVAMDGKDVADEGSALLVLHRMMQCLRCSDVWGMFLSSTISPP